VSFVKYFNVKIKQLQSKSRSGPLSTGLNNQSFDIMVAHLRTFQRTWLLTVILQQWEGFAKNCHGVAL